jgi:hypothetical protein
MIGYTEGPGRTAGGVATRPALRMEPPFDPSSTNEPAERKTEPTREPHESWRIRELA